MEKLFPEQGGRYFTFAAWTIPEGQGVKSDNADTEPVYTQFSRTELEQLGTMEGIGLAYDHKVDIEELATFGKADSRACGRIVDAHVTTKGGLINAVEIDLGGKEPKTPKEVSDRALRIAVVKAILNGHLKDVSLQHLPLPERDAEAMQERLSKHVLELSVTKKGKRPGSSIIHTGWSNSPYTGKTSYREPGIGEVACKAVIDHNNPSETYPAGRILPHIPTTQKKQGSIADTSDMADTTTTDLASLMAEMKAIRKEQDAARARAEKAEAALAKETEEKQTLKRQLDEAKPIVERENKRFKETVEKQVSDFEKTNTEILEMAIAAQEAAKKLQVNQDSAQQTKIDNLIAKINEDKEKLIMPAMQELTAHALDSNANFDRMNQYAAGMHRTLIAASQAIRATLEAAEAGNKNQATDFFNKARGVSSTPASAPGFRPQGGRSNAWAALASEIDNDVAHGVPK